ncbi:hypothetical protein PR048_023184 [Dryococelus australis]|uniref:Uncharacterized protein n=1 Tax=Dryococelus australis TaxID=614101 RepID=A0ABQ9GTG9_9NEOP|nr:hypothetical protein PR048_023184 [Dryococelus australis]
MFTERVIEVNVTGDDKTMANFHKMEYLYTKRLWHGHVFPIPSCCYEANRICNDGSGRPAVAGGSPPRLAALQGSRRSPSYMHIAMFLLLAPAQNSIYSLCLKCRGGRAVSLLASHQGDLGSIPGQVTPDFRMWELCWTMLFVGGFSGGSPVSPAFSFWHCSIFTSITVIGSKDLDAPIPSQAQFSELSHPTQKRSSLSQRWKKLCHLPIADAFAGRVADRCCCVPKGFSDDRVDSLEEQNTSAKNHAMSAYKLSSGDDVGYGLFRVRLRNYLGRDSNPDRPSGSQLYDTEVGEYFCPGRAAEESLPQTVGEIALDPELLVLCIGSEQQQLLGRVGVIVQLAWCYGLLLTLQVLSVHLDVAPCKPPPQLSWATNIAAEPYNHRVEGVSCALTIFSVLTLNYSQFVLLLFTGILPRNCPVNTPLQRANNSNFLCPQDSSDIQTSPLRGSRPTSGESQLPRAPCRARTTQIRIQEPICDRSSTPIGRGQSSSPALVTAEEPVAVDTSSYRGQPPSRGFELLRPPPTASDDSRRSETFHFFGLRQLLQKQSTATRGSCRCRPLPLYHPGKSRSWRRCPINFP